MDAIILMLFSLQLWVSISQTLDSPQVLDLTLASYAMDSYQHDRTRTGIPHSVHLPANLSAIKVQTARFRCGSLKRYGASSLPSFHLPIGLKIPHCVNRVVVIAQEIDPDRSLLFTHDYNLSGYQLVSPILGLLAYKDESHNFSQLELIAGKNKNPIRVDFGGAGEVKSPGMIRFCASFDDGKATLSEEIAEGVCAAPKSGRFGMVMELPEEPWEFRKKVSERKAAAVLSIGAVICAGLMALLMAAMLVKVKKGFRLEEMERRAYEEEALQVSMVGHARASPAQRRPVIEIVCDSIRRPP